jgi:hypothetical protein
MFGQLACEPEPPVPPDGAPDGADDAAGDEPVEADGSGLAALTAATPPIAINPAASRVVATTRRVPERNFSLGGSMAGMELEMSFASIRVLSWF